MKLSQITIQCLDHGFTTRVSYVGEVGRDPTRYVTYAFNSPAQMFASLRELLGEDKREADDLRGLMVSCTGPCLSPILPLTA